MSTSKDTLSKLTIAKLIELMKEEGIPTYPQLKADYINTIITWRSGDVTKRNEITSIARDLRIKSAARNIKKHISNLEVNEVSLALESNDIKLHVIIPLIVETGNVKMIKLVTKHVSCEAYYPELIRLVLKSHNINSKCVSLVLNDKKSCDAEYETIAEFIGLATYNNVWELLNRWPNYLIEFIKVMSELFVDELIRRKLVEKHNFYKYSSSIYKKQQSKKNINIKTRIDKLLCYMSKRMWYIKRFLLKFAQSRDIVPYIAIHIPINVDNLFTTNKDWNIEHQISRPIINTMHNNDKNDIEYLMKIIAIMRNEYGDTRSLFILLKKIMRYFRDNPEDLGSNITDQLLLQMSPWLE